MEFIVAFDSQESILEENTCQQTLFVEKFINRAYK